MADKITLRERDADADIWEWARQQAITERVSLARVIVDALRAYREKRTGQTK